MQSPPLPPEECVYKIQPLNLNVCQLRVDFNVIMEQPSVPKDNGSIKCEFDSFTIAGLELCGFNTNQHGKIRLLTLHEVRLSLICAHFLFSLHSGKCDT